MKDKKGLYYCFRYKCKNCPKNKQCEEEEKKTKGDKYGTNTKTREVYTKYS